MLNNYEFCTRSSEKWLFFWVSGATWARSPQQPGSGVTCMHESWWVHVKSVTKTLSEKCSRSNRRAAIWNWCAILTGFLSFSSTLTNSRRFHQNIVIFEFYNRQKKWFLIVSHLSLPQGAWLWGQGKVRCLAIKQEVAVTRTNVVKSGSKARCLTLVWAFTNIHYNMQ